MVQAGPIRSGPRAVLVAVLIATLLIGPGCTRKYFREKTDKEAFALLNQKSGDPRWSLGGFFVYPDPRARFADMTNPDRPPMPPDDPAARDLSPNPQKPGKAGVALIEGIGYMKMLEEWDAINRAELAAREPESAPRREEVKGDATALPPPAQADAEAEAITQRELADAVTVGKAVPEKRAEAAISKEKPFLLKMDQSVELGLINSREYQTRREQLFLAALPVTTERFAFHPQAFAAAQVFRERFGRETVAGPVNHWRINSTAGISQYFSTGALLLLSFANRTIYNLGRDPSTSVSTLSVDFIQPLLRGAGHAIALEPLTQAERNLLYAIRDYVKFQQEFYVFIAAGQPSFIPGVQAGVSAITTGTISLPGRFLPASPLLPIPLSGVGVSPQVFPGDGGRLIPLNGAGSTPQGFISAILEKAQLVNQYRNIQALRRYLDLFRVYREGDLVDQPQVNQVELQLLNSIQSSLSQQYNYRISIDQFKQQLGLPMCVPLELDDEPLRPMLRQTRRFEEVITDYDQIIRAALRFALPADVDRVRAGLRNLLGEGAFVRGTRVSKRVLERLDDWAKVPPGPGGRAANPIDQRIDELVKERDLLRDKRDKVGEGEKAGLPASDQRRLEKLDLDIEAGSFERALRVYERRPWEATKDEGAKAQMRNRMFILVYRLFLGLLENIVPERLDRVRKLWPDLPAACVGGVDLLEEDDDKVFAAVSRAALENRLDLMNNRAQLVDSWRKIKVAANALLGVANVEYHYDISTPAGIRQPLNFGGSRSRSQFILNSELPLVRVQQRNDYRAAIITYQQQRRQLQLAEDNILFSIRLDLRQLRAAATSYHKVQKRQIELAYVQVDQSLVAFSQPQIPAGPAAPVGSVGPPTTGGGTRDPAAATQQLLSAQNSLLGAQNGLYNTWVNYVTTRMSLYRDLGLMPLDPRGVWIDDIATCQCPAAPPGPGDEQPAKPGELPRPRAELLKPLPFPAAEEKR